MQQNFDLEQYLTAGVQDLLADAARAALGNPRETAFLARYALSARRAAARRARAAKSGDHVPSFLIASITERCNLACAGCYARANGACHSQPASEGMTAGQWGRIFREAQDLGVSLVLLAGGEPLLRADVLAEAAKRPGLLFPVFTNGTLLTPQAVALFDRHRNLVPILSVEGSQARTDARRGEGVHERLQSAMAALSQHRVLFGASVTVTRDNLQEITSADFLDAMETQGCKVILYVEYVPADGQSQALAPNEEDRALLDERLLALRQARPGVVFVSFPGDERQTSGCLAAGRGFFHINAHGGAEPCPFSPFSDTNLKDKPLREALRSPLFRRLREADLLQMGHDGGCALFSHEQAVRTLIDEPPAG